MSNKLMVLNEFIMNSKISFRVVENRPRWTWTQQMVFIAQPSMRIEFSINQPKMVPRLQSPHTIRPIRSKHTHFCVSAAIYCVRVCLSRLRIVYCAAFYKIYSKTDSAFFCKLTWINENYLTLALNLFALISCCVSFSLSIARLLCARAFPANSQSFFFSFFCFPSAVAAAAAAHTKFRPFFASNRCHYGHSMPNDSRIIIFCDQWSFRFCRIYIHRRMNRNDDEPMNSNLTNYFDI